MNEPYGANLPCCRDARNDHSHNQGRDVLGDFSAASKAHLLMLPASTTRLSPKTGQCLAVERTNVADEVFDTLAENPRGSARPFGSDAGAPSAMGQWQDGNSITFPEVSDRLLSSEKPGPSQDWDDAGRIARPHGSTCPVARCFA